MCSKPIYIELWATYLHTILKRKILLMIILNIKITQFLPHKHRPKWVKCYMSNWIGCQEKWNFNINRILGMFICDSSILDPFSLNLQLYGHQSNIQYNDNNKTYICYLLLVIISNYEEWKLCENSYFFPNKVDMFGVRLHHQTISQYKVINIILYPIQV